MTRSVAPLALAVVGLAAAAAATIVIFAGRSPSGGPAAPLKAAIVDQLSLTSPDPGFVSNATATIQAAGYTVDYIRGDQVTVDFYRDLPARGYGLVLVRAHSGFALQNPAALTEELRGQGETFLFSSEPYSQDKYVPDQRQRRLSIAFYFDPAGERNFDALMQEFKGLPRYFGIKPGFIESSARGRFNRTTVILMGCNGLSTQALAKAFVAKGAQAVVGWDNLVTAQHTDRVTSILLGHILIDKLPIGAAVTQTTSELGPDPTYGGKLTLYE